MILRCLEHLEFARAILFSSLLPSKIDPRITYERIGQIDFLGYSRFMIKELWQHIPTEHCLIVQGDGFVINPHLWDDDWLNYDYVGAPWAESVLLSGSPPVRLPLKNRVGNGGFSLRSQKLLRAASTIDFDQVSGPTRSEDLLICNQFYEQMLGLGIRYAPLAAAARFSMENPRAMLGQSLNTTFGFHGRHLLPAVMARLRPRV